jgi:hypothetical protein
MTKLWIKHLARVNMPVYKFESDTTKFVYAGYSSIKKNYYAKLFLNGNYHSAYLGRKWFWQIPGLINSANLDMAVSEISMITMDHFQKRDGYILPEIIIMRINIDKPISEICKRSVSDFPDIIRLIRKYNLTYELLTDNESFQYFNERIYLPYITKRHGDEALIEDLNRIWNSVPSPWLLAIKEEEVIVGAALIRKSGDCIYLLRLGLIDGNEEYRRHGVIGALYYFCILEGQKMGCRYLDIGGTRPFLTNGLTKYKLGLGGEFVSDFSTTNEYLWLGVNEYSSGAREFFSKNPFMHLSKEHTLLRYVT